MNKALLENFVKYCEKHPDQRFWQALRNWSGARFIRYQRVGDYTTPGLSLDTFNWEGRTPEDDAHE